MHAHILHGPVQRLVRGHRSFVVRPYAGCLVVDRVDRGAERRPGLLLEPIGGAGGGFRELDGEPSNGGGAVRSARTRPEPAERRHGRLRSRRASAKPEGPKGGPRARTTRPASSPALSALWGASGTRSALKLDATTRLPASLCRPLRKFDPRFDRSETSATSVRGTTPPQLAHAPARIGARRRRDEPTRERGAPPTRRRGERQSRRPMQVRATRSPRGPANPILPRAASRNVDYGNVRD